MASTLNNKQQYSFLSLLFLLSSCCCLIFASSDDVLPEYLAIVSQDPNTKSKVFSFLQQSFSQLTIQFPNDAKTILNDQNLIFNSAGPQAPWQYPDSWHTTVLYIGGNVTQLQTPYYQNFLPGKSVELQTYTFVYVPKKIICGPVFPSNVLIANPCPHMTLMMGEWSAVSSNYVLEALFTNNGPLQQQYQSGFFAGPDGTLVKKYSQLMINNELVDVYLIKVNTLNHFKYIDLPGVETEVYPSVSAEQF